MGVDCDMWLCLVLLDDGAYSCLDTQPEEERRREAEDRRRGPAPVIISVMTLWVTADGMPMGCTEEDLDPAKRAAKNKRELQKRHIAPSSQMLVTVTRGDSDLVYRHGYKRTYTVS